MHKIEGQGPVVVGLFVDRFDMQGQFDFELSPLDPKIN
jgi:hypothetical protein